MRVALHPCFVLHTRPFRDTSLLLDIFTHEHGRISGIARGVRGKRSPTRALLQPFTPLLMSWSGKTDLMSINKIEAMGIPYALSGSATVASFYMNELLVKLFHRYDPHPQLFEVYRETLVALSDAVSIERALRLFERALLSELGYGLPLECDMMTDRPISPEYWYRFDPKKGAWRAQPGSAQVFSGRALLALHSGDLEDSRVLGEVKRLMRLTLAGLLGEKEIKSREIF